MRILIALVALSTFMTISSNPAYSQGTKDTAINKGGQVVVSTNGECVRSKWDASTDVCAAEPEPTPPPKPKPVVKKPKPKPQPARDARTVYFDFNKSDLNSSEAEKLDALVRWLDGAKGVTSATVYGFADEIGNTEYNQKLSAKRAATVEAYLANKGVILPTNVEIVKGLGETGSVTSCDDSLSRAEKIKCLAADRRVEIKFEIVR